VERQTVELSALIFQALLTGLLALVYLWLWREQRRPYFPVWAAAWGAFALRLGFISAFLATRREIWLFAHQAATGITALLLLWAALVFARGMRWRRRYLWLGAVVIAWAYLAIFQIRDMRAAGLSSAIALATVTFGTGVVFWRHRRTGDPLGSTVLAWTFLLWGLHHLDYPLLRALGSGILYGVFADILFIVAATTGTLLLVLGDDRRALEARAHQLEQLTGLLLRAQEEERRRIARELHDEAGQILTAVKIELDLDGRREAGEMVGRALAQVRDLSNLLRPAVLDLGLVPALETLADDFERRTRIDTELRCSRPVPAMRDELQVAIYRVTQEALTNVARHSAARHVDVQLDVEDRALRLSVQDDGRGASPEATPHLGLLGMRERVTALGGTLRVEGHGRNGGGFRLEATIPMGAGA
jgi:signal transduction histidine kinase